MIKIYMHQYTITRMHKNGKDGIRSVTVEIVSEEKEGDIIWIIEENIKKFFDQDLTVAHKILIEGYRND